jgi:hypothetical protein
MYPSVHPSGVGRTTLLPTLTLGAVIRKATKKAKFKMQNCFGSSRERHLGFFNALRDAVASGDRMKSNTFAF